MSVEVVTFGCRLNAAESEVIRRAGGARRPRRHRGRQHLRGDRRSGAPGAPGDPRAAPRARRRQRSSSPAARRRPIRRRSPRWPRSTASSATPKSSTCDAWAQARAGFASSRRAEGDGRRHHGGQEPRRAPDRRLCRARPRLRAGAERLRSPLHLLHHSVRPRQFALGADGRGGRGRAPARRQRLSRNRADRRRHHELWRRSAGRAQARHAGAGKFSSRCPSSSGCGCPRSIRSRPTAICSTPSPRTSG